MFGAWHISRSIRASIVDEWLSSLRHSSRFSEQRDVARLAYSHALKTVREKIYEIEKCYDFIEVPFLTSYTQLRDMWN